ncbi:MAG TPA: TerC family protein [Steroidobacteraceae bacterium]|nr:TerC family protein [Steroidobacteraceae bacterium]
MEWLTDPTIWIGLLTLVVLEIVLGIDNLIFIAILANKLPPSMRDRARVLGLTVACFMRLALLASITWIMGLTEPFLTIATIELSWRDVILIGGGAFLLVKATLEMHDRLEAAPHEAAEVSARGRFWPVVAQIIVLDAVFSLDSVITAVGMVDQLPVMMAAVVIAVAVMILASGPLTAFVNAHPTVVVLCLGFLLMVGLVLIVDGLGYHIPKGYLYSAIGFSVLIESFNQLAQRNRRRWAESMPLRQRAADAVLRMIGGVPVFASASGAPQATATTLVPETIRSDVFTPAERDMVRGVLLLGERSVQSIMTPRADVVWIDANAAKETLLAVVRASTHRHFLVSRGTVDNVLGVARRADIVEFCFDPSAHEFSRIVREPVAVQEEATILDTLRLFKQTPIEIAIVLDAYGVLQGIVTHTDVLEAIAGELPVATQDEPKVRDLGDGIMSMDGAMAIHAVQARLGIEVPAGQFNTLAGFILFLLDRVPRVGEYVDWGGWRFEVAQLSGNRIGKVLARRTSANATSSTRRVRP